MTARILIVDDIAANLRVLEARLQAEYFDVRTANNGRTAIEIALNERIDLILLDVMMPDMSGFEVCAALKADLRTAQIPVVMVTALDAPEDRVRGLEAGADDFLTKPVDDLALLTRARSLIRLKSATDELSLKSAAMQFAGLDLPAFMAAPDAGPARVLVVDDRENSTRRIRQALDGDNSVAFADRSDRALDLAASESWDLVVVSLDLDGQDGLRLCAQMKSLDRLRHVPFLLVTTPGETQRLNRALELGVNDYITRPIDPNELRARASTQLRRKRYTDRLRDMVSSAVELAITDPLTGLYNRRYLDAHLKSLTERSGAASGAGSGPFCVLVFDIDHFKGINDAYGHDSGDDVLRGFAERMRAAVRGIDLVARYGGEEFVLVMPETDAAYAGSVAERIRGEVEAIPFPTRNGLPVAVTVSIGLAEGRGPGDSPEALFRRADQALYVAKRSGRNRVVASAA